MVLPHGGQAVCEHLQGDFHEGTTDVLETFSDTAPEARIGRPWCLCNQEHCSFSVMASRTVQVDLYAGPQILVEGIHSLCALGKYG